MKPTTFNPIEVSRGISEYGFMSVASACFLLMSITIMFLFIRWLLQIFKNFIEIQNQSLKEILQSLRDHNQAHKEQAEREKEQGRMLEEIRERVITPKSPKGDFEESLSSRAKACHPVLDARSPESGMNNQRIASQTRNDNNKFNS